SLTDRQHRLRSGLLAVVALPVPRQRFYPLPTLYRHSPFLRCLKRRTLEGHQALLPAPLIEPHLGRHPFLTPAAPQAPRKLLHQVTTPTSAHQPLDEQVTVEFGANFR